MPKPERLSDVLGRLIKSSALGHDFEHMEIYSVWRRVVDGEVVRHTRVVGVKANKLIIEVDSSPWLYELSSFRKRGLLDDLKRNLKKTRILDIEFRIGSF